MKSIYQSIYINKKAATFDHIAQIITFQLHLRILV